MPLDYNVDLGSSKENAPEMFVYEQTQEDIEKGGISYVLRKIFPWLYD